MNFNITPNAVKRIAFLMSQSKEKYIGLRVSVDGGGCSGFMYQYNLVDSVKGNDHVLTQSDGVKLIVDPISSQFLDGCTVDFVEELGSSYFQITNPNASSKCGCGNSFSV